MPRKGDALKISQPTRILLALVVGLAARHRQRRERRRLGRAQPIAIAEPIGGLWLNALQMTIVPLVVSLLITGIAASAEAARASRLAGRALILFVVAAAGSRAIIAALLTPLLLDLFPLPAESAAALRDALTADRRRSARRRASPISSARSSRPTRSPPPPATRSCR